MTAGLDAYDPPATYQTDIFTASLPREIPRLFARSYAGFAQRVASLSDEAVMTEFPELEACLELDAPEVSQLARSVTGVLKRHAAEVVRALAIQVGVHGEALYRGQLPDDCLLKVAAGPGATDTDATEAPAYGPSGPWERPGATAVESQEMPGAAGPDEQRRTTSPPPRFERRGKTWLVACDDEHGLVRHLTGMTYLARILKAGGQEVAALDLVSNGGPGGNAASAGNAHGLHATGDLGNAIDATARTSVQARAQDLESALQEAEATGDAAAQDRIRHELEALVDYLTASTGKGGRIRRVSDDQDRARQAVTQAVKRACTELGEQLPLLHAHLRKSLHMGRRCSYQPVPPRRWEVVI